MKEIYQPNKVKTKHRYLVHGLGEVLINYDFIAESKKLFYYQPNVKLFHWKEIWDVFDGWIEQVRNNDQSFSWDQLCKFPYLYRSLAKTQSIKFPVVMLDGNMMYCGTGRMLVIHEYFPSIPVDAFVISTQPRLDLVPINNMAELEKILLKRPDFRHRGKNFQWFFNITAEGYIFANDSGRTKNRFAFCTKSVNSELIDTIKKIINDNSDSKKIFRAICEIPVT